MADNVEPDDPDIIYLSLAQSHLGSTLPSSVCQLLAEYGGTIVSSDILDHDEQGHLLTMLETQLPDTEPIKLSVVYRGSRDGFGIKGFIDKMNGIENTIMVIHSDHGTKFGGYTQVPWSDDGQYHRDEKAFLYQMYQECKVFPILKGSEQWAVLHMASYTFPFFGNWGELVLYQDCNLSQQSNCFIKSWKETFDFKGNEVCGGNAHPISPQHFGFKVLELEMFQIAAG